MSRNGAAVQARHSDGNPVDIYTRLGKFEKNHSENTSRKRVPPLSILAAMGQPFTVLMTQYTNAEEKLLLESFKNVAKEHVQALPAPRPMVRIVVPAFHALLFHQGRVHCGDATADTYNLRFHSYYDHRDVSEPANETYVLGFSKKGEEGAAKYYKTPRSPGAESEVQAVRLALRAHVRSDRLHQRQQQRHKN